MSDHDIESLRNLGPVSAGWLKRAGIRTIAHLERLGPAAAFRIVKQQQPTASLNLLWAIAAALADKDWRTLTPHEKRRLQNELQRL